MLVVYVSTKVSAYFGGFDVQYQEGCRQKADNFPKYFPIKTTIFLKIFPKILMKNDNFNASGVWLDWHSEVSEALIEAG